MTYMAILTSTRVIEYVQVREISFQVSIPYTSNNICKSTCMYLYHIINQLLNAQTWHVCLKMIMTDQNSPCTDNNKSDLTCVHA